MADITRNLVTRPRQEILGQTQPLSWSDVLGDGKNAHYFFIDFDDAIENGASSKKPKVFALVNCQKES